MLSSIKKQICFSKYLNKKQIVVRLLFTLKRKLKAVIIKIIPYSKTLKIRELDVSDHLKMPLFPPRTGHVNKLGCHWTFNFLNQTMIFKQGIEWFPKQSLLWTMHLHYMEYLEALSDESFTAMVSNWIQSVRPITKNYWLNSWNAYTISIRTTVWMQQYALRQHTFADDFKKLMLSSVFEQISYLYHNLEIDILGNHLIKNIKSLIWAASFFQNKKTDKWLTKAKSLLTTQIKEQILVDGMHFELSPSYHCQVFADLLEIFYVGDEDIKLLLKPQLMLMAEATKHLTHPDGYISLFGDGGLEMAYSSEECLQVYEKLFQTPVAAYQHIRLHRAGYYGYRDEHIYFLADCGRIAPDTLVAHGHGDILSFELSLGEERIFVDPGVYEYPAGEMRQYSKSTSSHNTVTINHEDQAEFFGSFRMGRRPEWINTEMYEPLANGLKLIGEHNAYQHLQGSPLHRREFHLSANCLQIKDNIIYKSYKDVACYVSIKAHLLLAPHIKTEVTEAGIILKTTAHTLFIKSPAEITINPAWWCPNFGVKLATQQIVFWFVNPFENIIEIEWEKNKVNRFAGKNSEFKYNLPVNLLTCKPNPFAREVPDDFADYNLAQRFLNNHAKRFHH